MHLLLFTTTTTTRIGPLDPTISRFPRHQKVFSIKKLIATAKGIHNQFSFWRPNVWLALDACLVLFELLIHLIVLMPPTNRVNLFLRKKRLLTLYAHRRRLRRDEIGLWRDKISEENFCRCCPLHTPSLQLETKVLPPVWLLKIYPPIWIIIFQKLVRAYPLYLI